MLAPTAAAAATDAAVVATAPEDDTVADADNWLVAATDAATRGAQLERLVDIYL